MMPPAGLSSLSTSSRIVTAAVCHRGGQSTENRAARRRLVEVEGLRIEFGSEREDPFLVDRSRPEPNVCPTAKSSR